MRYSLLNGAGFVGVSLRDQSVCRDISSTLSSTTPGAGPTGGDAFAYYSGSSIFSHTAAYDFDAQVPLGRQTTAGDYATTALFRHQTSIADQTVNGHGADTSPYLYNDRDIIADDTLEIHRVLPRGTLSARYALTSENLTTDSIPGVVYADAYLVAPSAPGLRLADGVAATTAGQGTNFALLDAATAGACQTLDDAIVTTPGVTQQGLTQIERSLGLRYAAEPTSHLHYTFAASIRASASSGRRKPIRHYAFPSVRRFSRRSFPRLSSRPSCRLPSMGT